MNPLTVPNRPTIRKAAPLAVLLLAFPLLIAVLYLGTPTPAQAATIEKCGPLSGDETWTSSNVFDIRCDVTVPSGITLTIQAGTVVKIRSGAIDLIVYGTLDSQGTASDRVVFTSINDDSYGIATNADDGTATSPVPGDWGAIKLFNDTTTLKNTRILYAGRGDIYSDYYGSVYILDSSPTVENNIIRYSKNYGIYIDSGSPSIKDNSFIDSGVRHLYHGANANPSYSSNTFTGTGGGAIDVAEGEISTDITWQNIQGLDWPYHLLADLTVSISGTLTIQAGTIVKFDNRDTGLHVNGTLDAQGTTSDRVIFTSYKDDANGGDTNGDGAATTPAPGDWATIDLRNSASALNYTLIQYGGYYFSYGVVYIYVSSPTVENNIIRDNFNNSIYIFNGSPTIKDNTIENSAEYGLVVTIGSPTVTGNSFTDSGTRHLSHGANGDPNYSGNTFSGTGGGAIDIDGGILTNDITWENIQDLNWPYLLISDLSIHISGTLRLPPGTVIKFRYSTIDLNVNGTLDVQGTASDRVVFTSYKDDSYGGDTNGDGATTAPAAGDWSSIQLNNSANTLDYTLIQYGGSAPINGSVHIRDSSPTIEYNLIRHSDYAGIYIHNGSPNINHNNIEDSNNYGLDVFTGSPTVKDNAFSNSGTYHLFHGANANPFYAGNTFSGTGGGAIDVGFGSIETDITWENIQGLNWPYLVPSLTLDSNSTLTIKAGTIVKFKLSTADLIVDGLLDLQGTADNRVIFTSYKDDSYGGDTNGDGAATMPAAGDWSSIKLRNSAVILDYALIQYGGGDSEGGIYIIYSSPIVKHNVIRYNNYGLYVSSGTPSIRQNDISGNTDYGVYNHRTTSIDAAHNWWGHASGPSGVGPGSGDAVSDYVDYTPWLDAPANPISDPIPPSSSILTYLPFVLR